MPTSFEVLPKPFCKTLNAPPAKSYAGRLLILAAMDSRQIVIENIPSCSDTSYLISAFEKIGLKISKNKNKITIHNSFPADERETSDSILIKIGDGGTTTRFLMALLSRGKNRYILEVDEVMAARPMAELMDSLRGLGVKVEKTAQRFIIQGPAKCIGKTVWMDCKKTSQFASAFMLAFGKEISLKIKNLHTSKKYISLTENLIKNFKKSTCFTVPADFTSASYPLALGLIAGKAHISNIKHLDEYQADSSFIDIVNKMGAQAIFDEKGLHIQKKQLKKISLDCSHFLDLVPTLAFLCTRIQGDSILYGLDNLQYKEAHRLEAIAKLLALSGVYAEKSTDRLLIKGEGAGNFFEYHPPNDHRMVMAAYLFMRSGKGGIIHNALCVKKSWPDFFAQMEN